MIPLYFVAGLFRGGRVAQNVVLLAFSLVFYAWGEPTFVFIMMGSIVANWAFGLLIDANRERRRVAQWGVALMLATNLGLFFVFKYLMFATRTANMLFGAHLTVPKIALPIGISFFTFQAITYCVDVYRGDAKVQKNPLYVALYISFFPQLIAGPIVRYQTVAEQIMGRRESLDKFCTGLCRFVVGLGKKAIIANQLGVISAAAFSAQGDIGGVNAWVGVACYTLQIYYDFSSYSDMAIGLARMFGFELLENFNYPFMSQSVAEFWQRWHISLGSFFKDYVYFPLGGSRVATRGRLFFNLAVVWFLTGLWHGASFNFILWGLYFLAFVIAERQWQWGKSAGTLVGRVARRLYAFLVFMFGFVIFNTATLAACGRYACNMFSRFDIPVMPEIRINWVFIVAGAIFSVPLLKERVARYEHTVAYKFLYVATLVAVFVWSISFIVMDSFSPFIYFNF
ncbi:MAG: MBOAT family protein [Kiritimatiellaeota bacterium]|nr:MBOAT family protein [Kiritimatiellota bacterium]